MSDNNTHHSPVGNDYFEYSPTRCMSAYLPVRFTAGVDFPLWLKWFELYIAESPLPQELRARELLSLLEDKPFQSVSKLGLEDFKANRDTLYQRYSPECN